MKTRVLIGIIAVLFIFSIINAYGVTREQDCLPDQELECAPCALGTIDCPCECVPKKTISPITNPEDEIKNNDTVQNNTLNNPECNGCVLNGKCLSFGLRQGGKYCSITGEFSEQKKGKEECDNNFECKSNVCVDGSCIEQGFFTRLMSWLKGLFKIAEKETEKKEPEKINEEKNENCEQVKKDITKELQKINYCSRNDECEYGLPDGVGPAEILYTCGVYYNKQADLTKLRELDNAHSKKNCPRRAMTSCLSRDSFDVVCVNKKCGMKIKTEQKSDCEKLYSQALEEAKKVNYCSNDNDCLIKSGLSGAFSCGIYYNKNTDLSKFMSSYNKLINANCAIAVDCYPLVNSVKRCENGKCEAGAKKSGNSCGNGICESGEGNVYEGGQLTISGSCLKDCPGTISPAIDGSCMLRAECGDGVCGQDCKSSGVCSEEEGWKNCLKEDAQNCPQDCSGSGNCGDGKCEGFEVHYLPPACDPVEGEADCNVLIYCPQDCGTDRIICGDGICNGNEVPLPGAEGNWRDNSYFNGNFICGKDCGAAP